MDERVWSDRPLEEGEAFALGGVSIRRPAASHLTHVSGRLDVALPALAPGAPLAGLAGETGTGDHAIRIGRDHALLVTGSPVALSWGWDERGFAVSGADDCFVALDVSGDNAALIIAHGASVDPGCGSPSAAIGFAGETVLLVRCGADYRIWVEAPMLTYFTGFLRGADAAV